MPKICWPFWPPVDLSGEVLHVKLLRCTSCWHCPGNQAKVGRYPGSKRKVPVGEVHLKGVTEGAVK